MNKVFKNIQEQSQFELNGYVNIPLLDSETCANLLNYYNNIKSKVDVKNSVYGIYVSLDDKDRAFKDETMLYIQESIQPKLDNLLENYKVHLGGFIIKQSDSFSYTYPHQDWTFVDNKNLDDFSATIWISLEDQTPETGSLGFVNGSHKFLDGIVGSPSSVFINSTQGHEDLLFQYLNFPTVKAGDGLVFNNKCAHGANPNLSGKDRIIVGIGITPKDANLYHYFLQPGTTNQVLKLKVGEDFFMDYMNDDLINTYMQGNIPQNCEVVDQFEFTNKKLSTGEMTNLLVENGCIQNSYSIQRPVVEQQHEDKEQVIDQTNTSEADKPSTRERIAHFFKVYTPYNVYKESKYRLTGKY